MITARDRQIAAEYRMRAAQYKAAKTRHENEQRKGLTDGSARQTRRMALAVAALQRASFRYSDAQRNLFQGRG